MSDFVSEQKNDNYCKKLAKEIESNQWRVTKPKKAKKVIVYDGEEDSLRYTIYPDGTIGTTTGRIVVPTTKKEKVLWRFHNDAYVGHLGIKKTLDRIKRRFIWQGMNKDIVNYVKNCIICAKRKVPKHNKAPLRPIQPPSNVWELIAMDIVGPLQETPDRNSYILVIADYLTCYVVTAAMPNKASESVSKAL